MKRAIAAVFERFGYAVVPLTEKELDSQARDILSRVRPFTMTSVERVNALIEATKYVVRHGVPGAFVECGVWRGGSMMAVALTLLAEGDATRDLFLFDTFEGMTEPTTNDRDQSGKLASDILAETKQQTGFWCYASLDDVQQNIKATGYPEEKLHFVKGKVEDTLPFRGLSQIALLRLDTDWYDSTYHELTHLYPLLTNAGVLILDDYGYWQGAQQATDKYFSEQTDTSILLNRIDSTGRIAVKCNRNTSRDGCGPSQNS